MGINFLGKNYIDLIDCCKVLKLDIHRVRNSMYLGNSLDSALKIEVERIKRSNELKLQIRKQELGINRELKFNTAVVFRSSCYDAVCMHDDVLDSIGYIIVTLSNNIFVASKNDMKQLCEEYNNIHLLNATSVGTKVSIVDTECTYDKLREIMMNNSLTSFRQAYYKYVELFNRFADAV